jgi:hypothetical protein
VVSQVGNQNGSFGLDARYHKEFYELLFIIRSEFALHKAMPGFARSSMALSPAIA